MQVETTFAVIASYQYMENYGAHDWDGHGQCPQRWKCKGRHEEVIMENITVQDAAQLSAEKINKRISETRLGHGISDDYVRYYLLDHFIVTLDQELVDKVSGIRAGMFDPDDAMEVPYILQGVSEYAAQWALDKLGKQRAA